MIPARAQCTVTVTGIVAKGAPCTLPNRNAERENLGAAKVGPLYHLEKLTKIRGTPAVEKLWDAPGFSLGGPERARHSRAI